MKIIDVIKNWFQNMSSTEIPNDIKNVLKLGPYYTSTVQCNYISTNNIIANIEDEIQI